MWFIKLLGVALIVLSSLGISLRAVQKLKRRVDAFHFFSGAAATLAIQMNSTAAELYDIVNTLYGRQQYLELTKPFSVALKPCGLRQEETKTIEEFFEGLGMGELSAQVKRCEGYAAVFSECYREAKQEYTEKSKLYKMLGLFSGLSIAIILV